MNNSASGRNSSHPPANGGEAARNTRGTSVAERIKQLWDSDRALRKPLQSLTQSTTPSSAGDIDPPAPPNVSDIVSPLRTRIDKGPTSTIESGEYLSTPVPFVAPQALHYNVEQIASIPEVLESNMQTEPAETAESNVSSTQEQDPDAVEQEVHVLNLSEMEFAIPLSMDCRVKDEYDNTLEGESKYVEKFLEGSPDSSEIGPSEGDNQALLLRMATMIEKLDNITTHPDINIVNQAPGASPDAAKEALWAEYSSSKFQYLGYFMDASKELDLHIILMAKPGRTVDVVKRYLLGKKFSQHPLPENEEGGCPAVFSKENMSFEVRSTAEEREIPSAKPLCLIIALDSSFNIDRELQDDALGVQENAEETLFYVMENPASRSWKLPLMEALEIEAEDESPPSGPDPMSSIASSRQKRWLEGEMSDSTNPSKRQRITPIQDITQISDSMKDQTQTEQDSNLSAATVHRKPSATTAETESLRAALTSLRSKVKTLEASIGALQYRYEAKHNQLHETRHELDVERETMKKSQAKFERQKEEISKIKDRNVELVTELEAARDTIKSGGGLESDLEKSREEVRNLQKTMASLERTVQQERSQTEYTRQQYQNASTSAAQSAMEARQLEERVKDLTKKANGEAARLKELRIKEDEQKHLARIKELEVLLASREALLTKKEEEIREMKKNRPSTRATSMQPRSPKYGTSRPSSPGPNHVGSAVRGSALKFRAEI
ncbi:uncharacterized protein GIQ15_06494 [Arthroderma uncinatum]|uniref:uncharacterized protein n=1 Tax=Arthroderma uncinatum TaxID=74035 RepID=UPI00144A859B|nr:uncharacterized protein GIQ15_06494 [Arthroderma uncinatum]KAF3479518.1 hypothetical protein GIQ15_06494 [Arthroderma uncinatum]